MVAGTITFTPSNGFFGVAGFDYTVAAPSYGTTEAHVQVTVQQQDHPPVITGDSLAQMPVYNSGGTLIGYTTNPYAGTFSVADQDYSASALNWSVINQPQIGNVSVDGSGNWSYSNGQPVGGSVAFVVQVADPLGGTSQYTVHVPLPTPPASSSGEGDGGGGGGGDNYSGIVSGVGAGGTIVSGDGGGGGGGGGGSVGDGGASVVVGDGDGYHNGDGDGGGDGDPLILDLHGTGFNFTSLTNSTVFFQQASDGLRHQTAWFTGGNGILAFDEYGTGIISDSSETDFYTQVNGATNDLEALELLANGAPQLNATNPFWSKLGVWVDSNNDGVCQPGEFQTLTQLGIVSINFASTPSFSVQNGVVITKTVTFTYQDGTTQQMAEVMLPTSNQALVGDTTGGAQVVTASQTGNTSPITAGDGNNIIYGHAGDNYITAGNGNNVVMTGTGNQVIELGNGDNDIQTGQGQAAIVSGNGNNTIVLGNGNKTVVVGSGNNTVIGGNGDNIIMAAGGNNILYAGSGNSLVYAQDGNNTLIGGAGNDKLIAGNGNNTFNDGGGRASMTAGTGSNTFTVTNTADTIMVAAPVAGQSAGVNTVKTSVNWTLGANQQILWGTGSAALTLTGNNLDDQIIGNGAADTLIAGTGNDTLADSGAAVTMIGGSGNDTFIVTNAGTVIQAASGAGASTVKTSVNYTLPANVDTLQGTGNSALTLTGSSQDGVTIIANNANDTLIAGSGASTLIGGSGNDSFMLGAGNETVQLGAGQSTVVGGSGNNVVTGTSAGNANVTLGNGNNTIQVGSGSNQIQVGNGTNQITTGAGTNVITVGSGNDKIINQGGSDALKLQLATPTTTRFKAQGNDLVITENAGTSQPSQVVVSNQEVGRGVSAIVIGGNTYSAATVTAIQKDVVTVSQQTVNQTATAGSVWNYTLPSTLFGLSVSADTLTYSASLTNGQALPDWLSLDAVTGQFSGTPPESAGAGVAIQVTATSMGGSTASATLQLEIDDTYTGTSGTNTIAGVGAVNTLTYASLSTTGQQGIQEQGIVANLATGRIEKASGLTGMVADALGESGWASFADLSGPTAMGLGQATFGGSWIAQAFSNVIPITSSVLPDTYVYGIMDAGLTKVALVQLNNDVASGGVSQYKVNTYYSQGNQLTNLASVDFANSADWYDNSGSDGYELSSVTYAQAQTDTVSNIQTLIGTAGDDVLIAGNGNETLEGGGGHNIYVVDAGNGTDKIIADEGRLDTLELQGTTAATTRLVAQGDDLLITLDVGMSTQSQVVVSHQETGGGVGTVVIDGTSYSAATIEALQTASAVTASQSALTQTATAGTAWSYLLPSNLFGTSVAGDSLVYSATLVNGNALPSWLSFDSTTGQFSGIPSEQASGALALQVTATDLSGATASTVLTVTVAHAYQAPTVTENIGLQSAVVGALWSYTLPDGLFTESIPGDTLTYSASLANAQVLPSWLNFDANTGQLSGIPSADAGEGLSIILSATDEGGLSASTSLDLLISNAVTVASVPSTATAGAGSDSTQTAISSTTTGMDVLGQATFGGSWIARPIARVTPIVSTVQANTYVYGVLDAGLTKVVQVQVSSDATGSSGSEYKVSTYYAQGDQLTKLASTNFAQAAGWFDNSSSGGYQLSSVTSQQVQTGAITNIATLSGNVSNDVLVAGTGSVTLSGGSGSKTYVVNAGSSTDTINANAGQIDTLQLQGTTSETTRLTALGNDLLITLDAGTTTQSHVILTNQEVGGGVGTLVIGGTSYNAATMAALQRDAVMVSEAVLNQTINAGSVWNYALPTNLFATTVSADTLAYSATLTNGAALPAWLSFDTTTGQFSGTPTEQAAGVIALQVTGTGMNGASASAALNLTVAPAYQAPTVTESLSAQNAVSGALWSYSVPNGLFNESIAGDTLTYSASLSNGQALPTWLSFNATTAQFSGTPPGSSASGVGLEITATDLAGLSASAALSLNISASNATASTAVASTTTASLVQALASTSTPTASAQTSAVSTQPPASASVLLANSH